MPVFWSKPVYERQHEPAEWRFGREWIDLSPIVPAGGNVVQYTRTHAHVNPAVGRANNGKGSGSVRVCNGVPTPCHGLRLRHWDRRDREWTWIDRMWLLHSVILSEQPETRHFARYRIPRSLFFSLSICPVGLCRSYYNRDGENNRV